MSIRIFICILADRPLQKAVGIVRLVLHQAKELDQTKSLSGDLNPFAKVYLNHSTTSSFQTPIFKHTNSPVWESPYEFLCIDKSHSIITIKIVDERDFLKDPVIGYMSIRLEDLIFAKTLENRDWFPLSGCKQGKLRVSAEWKPLAMAGAFHGSDQYKPPIGVVRLVLEKATDVKNVEAMLGGKVCWIVTDVFIADFMERATLTFAFRWRMLRKAGRKLRIMVPFYIFVSL